MRRLFRILTRVATVLSLVVFLASIVLWLRSYTCADYIAYQRASSTSFYAISDRGMIQWKAVLSSYPPQGSAWRYSSDSKGLRWNIDYDMGLGADRWERGGRGWLKFEIGHGAFRNAGIQTFPPRQYTYSYLNTPYMVFVVMAASPCLLLMFSRWKRRRPINGICSKCGYDLRATPDRCPECGAVPAAATADHANARNPTDESG